MTPVEALKALCKRYTNIAMIDTGTAEDTLIMTLLSARSRDEQIIAVYPLLRKTFPTLQSLAKADVKEIETHIKTVGLYHAKAKALKALAHMLLADFKGVVPRTMEELIRLPGVGRKTASCVLGYAFKLPAIAVDTHVFRVARRLGWASGHSPEQVEADLKRVIPEKLWREVNRVFIQLGRDICKPGKPECWRCPIREACAFQPKTPPPTSEKR